MIAESSLCALHEAVTVATFMDVHCVTGCANAGLAIGYHPVPGRFSADTMRAGQLE